MMTDGARPATVGFIGLGAMGSGMAANILRSGQPVVGYDIDDARIQQLLEQGGQVAEDPADVAEQAEVVITMVDTTAQTEDVVLGERGVARGARAGDVLVCMSTIDPTAVIRMQEQLAGDGVRMIDAPVSGMIKGATEGTLRAFVGGDADALDRARTALDAMTSEILHVGPIGRGVVLKLINNMLYKINSVAAMEGMVLGVKAGLDPAMMRDVIAASTGASVAFDYRARRMIERDFDGVRLDISCKDLELEGALGRAYSVPLFLHAACTQVYEMGRAAGLGDQDATAIVTIYEQLTGVSVGDVQTPGS